MYKQEDLEKAITFAAEKHKGQKRKDGSAYIYHPIMAAAMLKDAEYGYEYQIAAGLHDILEDTETIEEELAEFGEEIVEAVKCLTRPDGMDEEEYVELVLSNRIASVVKSADKIHNVAEIVQLNPVGKRTSSSLRERKNRKKAQKYVEKSRRYYAKNFMPEVDAQITHAETVLSRVSMPGTAGLTINIANMKLYSDLRKIAYESAKKMSPSLEKPDISREFVFFEDMGTYYAVYKENFTCYGPMKAWYLDAEGWVLTSYDLYDPDDITIIEKEWMVKIIEDRRKEGYFYDFVEFPIIKED